MVGLLIKALRVIVFGSSASFQIVNLKAAWSLPNANILSCHSVEMI